MSDIIKTKKQVSSHFKNDSKAAQAIGISAQAYYNWPMRLTWRQRNECLGMLINKGLLKFGEYE